MESVRHYDSAWFFFVFKWKVFSLLHHLVERDAKAGGDLLDGVAPDAFHLLLLEVEDAGGVAALRIETDVYAK